MAVRAEEVVALESTPVRQGMARRAIWPAVALGLLAGALFAIRLDRPAFFDNEGRYAEVAREMVLLGDYLTPRLDFEPFLNKPPLTFWLAALIFRIAGATEWARLVPVAAAVIVLITTCRLGAFLYGEAAGLIAGVILATSLGFVLEARTLRPDMVLTASVVVALFCWQRARTAGMASRGRWLVGLYATLGVGMLAKGLVPVILAAIPIAAITLREEGWRGVRRLRPGLGVVVIGLITLPWHFLVASRNPGFAWDYVVNQHLLFFLDKKLPRDSEGDSLVFFWLAYVGRAIPWVLLLPLNAGEAARGFTPGAAPPARATFFLWTWAAGLLVFFSFAPSRLEHYSIPALPAAALLAARVWQRARAGELGRAPWVFLLILFGTIAVTGALGTVYGKALLARTYWIAEAPGLARFIVPASTLVAATFLLAAAAAARRQATLVVATLAVGMVPITALVVCAEAEAEAILSWRPVAQVLASAVPADTEIVFEAPQEYQLVGGLAFYTGRRITLLRPPDFVPPTYLRRRNSGMFLERADFERRWRAGEPLAFVSDPLRRREEPAGLVPEPFVVLGRFGDRWVLGSAPVSARR